MHNVLFKEAESGETVEFKVKDNDVLFEALESQGKELPHGCLAGSCGACRIEILDGAENLKEPSTIEADTINSIRENYKRRNQTELEESRTVRLSCRAKVKGDCTFTVFK